LHASDTDAEDKRFIMLLNIKYHITINYNQKHQRNTDTEQEYKSW